MGNKRISSVNSSNCRRGKLSPSTLICRSSSTLPNSRNTSGCEGSGANSPRRVKAVGPRAYSCNHVRSTGNSRSFSVCPSTLTGQIYGIWGWLLWFGAWVVADFGVQRFNLLLKFIRTTKLQVCTSASLTKNPCSQLVFSSLQSLLH